jgi:cyclopropane fatty-acyl-phospholipid synthase-like methyltransferase
MRLPADETVPHQEEDYLNQRASEEWTLTPIALDVAEVLDVGKSRRGLRVLEIGCGSAVFASTIAHRDADSVINLLDTQAGLRQAQKTIESIGLGRQTELIEVSDPFAIDSIPELEDQLFDLILVVGIVHRLQQERFQKLFRDIYPLIKPERELAVIDVFPGQEKGELQRSIFELELGLRTHHGQLHEPAVLESALKEAGFSHLQYAHLPSAPHYWGLLLAQRG